MEHCKQCGYDWKPRVENPKECPACKRRNWNVKITKKGEENSIPKSVAERDSRRNSGVDISSDEDIQNDSGEHIARGTPLPGAMGETRFDPLTIPGVRRGIQKSDLPNDPGKKSKR